MTSRKPSVKKFQKWVTSEVIPSIRKTGNYSIEQSPQTRQLLIEQSETVAQCVERIQNGLGRTNPRIAQILIDLGVNDFIESNQKSLPASTEFPEDRWYGLVQIADKMGIKTNESTRVKLGQYVGSRCQELGIDRVREKRLCNGQYQPIWCYRDNSIVRSLIADWDMEFNR